MRRRFAGILLSIFLLVGCKSGSPRAVQKPAATNPALDPAIGPALRKKLAAALAAKGPDYKPHTRHLNPDGSPSYTNRLILESSPYLLQHAHNPVNWFPWGDEAFAMARATGRPVFLSIGYSTCHWCHVMEEESFEDERIAAYLNEHYIAIKVDREERPDIDAIYMEAVEMLTGRGGWPMSVWLTPERKPFYGGTYFPPRDGDHGAAKGFLGVLRDQYERFKASPGSVATDARALADRVRQALSPGSAGGLPGAESIDRAVATAAARFDPAYGGGRGAPKFPSSFPVRLLLRQWRRTGDAHAREMAIVTLQRMAQGGIHDQLGGGFHRYSTDARWLVPHFEKMLCDQALLAVAYLEGYQASGDADLARVARDTLDGVARDMTSPGGGFYSATDADSPGPGGRRAEGYYFTWTPAEVQAAVGADRARAVDAMFGVTDTGDLDGRSILHTPQSRDEVAASLHVGRPQLDATLAASMPLLLAAREQRAPPFRDEKIQASWNGLMIGAFARGARVLAEPRYAGLAARAADFVLGKLRVGGRLHHSVHDGRVGPPAYLDDCAFLASGLLDLFELSGDPRWLDAAIAQMNALETRFRDSAHGGYYQTASDGEALIARDKPDSDDATPNGNSVALLDQLRLYELTTDDKWRAAAETTLRAFAGPLAQRPASLDQMLLAVEFRAAQPKEIAIVLPDASPAASRAAAPLLDVLRTTFAPDRVLVVAPQAALAGELGARVPWAKNKPAKGGKARAYVCRRGACELPTGDPAVFRRQLAQP